MEKEAEEEEEEGVGGGVGGPRSEGEVVRVEKA